MGKILGKSALCFAGLAVGSWLVQQLVDFIMLTHKITPFITTVFYSFFIYIMLSLMAIVYPYVLYQLFKNERHSNLIIALNGIFAILQYYLLLFISAILHTYQFTDMLFVSFVRIIPTGYSTLIFALMFKSLQSGKMLRALQPGNKVFNIHSILGKSSLCLLGLTAVAYGYELYRDLMPSLIGSACINAYVNLIGPENIIYFAFPYAYCLFRLFRQNRNRRLLLIINAVFLLAIYAILLTLMLTQHEFKIAYLAFVAYGNASIVTIALSFIFNKVEKHKTALPTYQNAPEDSITPSQ